MSFNNIGSWHNGTQQHILYVIFKEHAMSMHTHTHHVYVYMFTTLKPAYSHVIWQRPVSGIVAPPVVSPQ